MKKICNTKECTGCYGCKNICPKNCIKMEYQDGFWYPKIRTNDCIDCNLCHKVCPINNFEALKTYKLKSYAAYSKDDSIRNSSSSGGLFTSLASIILENNGVIFGAAYDNNFDVVHTEVQNIEELYKLRGSKYVQSKIGFVYKNAKKHLDEGRLVYFSGTACQIDGLKSYLMKDYNNLICQDLICHGVPSPLVWQKYLKEIKKTNKVNEINFRDKSDGWYNYSLKIVGDNLLYQSKSKDDLYLRGFSQNIYLRPSCYNCKYKTIERNADITLADFWGIENEVPEMFDDKGTSFVIIHSDKGQKLFDSIKNDIIFKEVDIESGAKYQSTLKKSAFKNPDYNKFFKNMNKMSFDKLYKKYFSDRFILKLKRTIARKLNN